MSLRFEVKELFTSTTGLSDFLFLGESYFEAVSKQN